MTLPMRCERTKWQGRAACLLANEVLELTHLTGGGHIADLHFRAADHNMNPFWTPRWKTLEPYNFDPDKHSRLYGAPELGRVLSGIAGHSVCLDLFGMPSPEEALRGGSLHGEAGVLKWKVRLKKHAFRAELLFSVALPLAALTFSRSLLLRSGESLVYVRESVKNERKVDQFFQWQQHATLGAPFLSTGRSTIALPGKRGRTYPSGYEGHELLKSDAEFDWPFAPRFDGGRVDLRRALIMPGKGFVAGVQIEPDRSQAFVCAVNAESSLAIGYCFRREDFPWVALWEENGARQSSPWKGREKTRGLEFGSSPLPLTRAENFRLGEMFGTPTLAQVPAGGTRTARYAVFLARLPAGTHSIKDVVIKSHSLDLISASGRLATSLPAHAIGEHLA